jgi:membrane glycosyltransferase
MNEKEQMKLDMVKNLALLLMDNDPQLTMEQALSTVINSDTYQRLQNDATRLYYQSPRYVFSFLDSELKTGSIK